jgi:hypothetical protein
LRTVWPGIQVLPWRPHWARRQRARLCLSRLDWPCLLPPALAAGRQSATSSVRPSTSCACWALCWPGPPPSLLRAALCPTYYAVDSCYNSGTTRPPTRLPPPSTRACPRPAVCIHHIHHQAPRPCLGPIPSLSLALAPLLHHTARPRNSHTRPRLPAQASLVEPISCNRLRPATATLYLPTRTC